jgi:hypothetical protein
MTGPESEKASASVGAPTEAKRPSPGNVNHATVGATLAPAGASGKRCSSCAFWRPRQRNTGWGECRARPPFPAQRHVAGEDAPLWPVTRDDEWCGTWRPREGAPGMRPCP